MVFLFPSLGLRIDVKVKREKKNYTRKSIRRRAKEARSEKEMTVGSYFKF